MIIARAVAALAACAAAFERVCPGDQPTNVSDTIFTARAGHLRGVDRRLPVWC